MTKLPVLAIGCCSMVAASVLFTGCVSEPGRHGNALWSKVETRERDDDAIPLRNPGRVSVAYGKVQEQRGQFTEARLHYQSALQQDSRSAEAILGLARLDQYAGRTREAEAGFQRALKLDPKNPHAHDSYAMFLATQNRWKESASRLRIALKSEPNNVEYQKKLAIALAKNGQLSAAYEQFLVSVGEAEAHYYMGLILMERGQQGAASQQFQLALQHAPDMDAARGKLAELHGGELPESLADQQRQSPSLRNRIQPAGHSATQRGGYYRDRNEQFGSANDHDIVITPGPRQPPVVRQRRTSRNPSAGQNAVILPAKGRAGNGVQTLSSGQIQQWSNQLPAN